MLNAQVGNTPDGQVPVFAGHISWLDDSVFLDHPNGLGIQETDDIVTSGVLQNICDASCAYIERICGRYFVQQTVWEQHFDVTINRDRQVIVPLRGTPITQINSIYVQYLNSFISIAFDYLTTLPKSGGIAFYPSLFLNGSGSAPVPETLLHNASGNLWVNYTFGQLKTNINPILVEAACLLTTKYIGMQENPSGASIVKTGDLEVSWRQMKGQFDPITEYIENLVSTYKSKFFFTTT